MRSRLPGACRAALAAAATVATLALPAAAQADAPDGDAPPTDKITLDVLTVNGSGCPAGTAHTTVLSDNTGFRITYGAFVAAAGGSAERIDFRKNCQIGLIVNVPQGFTYAVARLENRGRARLDAGSSGLLRTNYYFQGSPDNNISDHAFNGPLNGPWSATDQKDIVKLVFAPCGERRALNVNTELRVDADGNRTNIMSMRSSEGDVDTLFHFQWKRCE